LDLSPHISDVSIEMRAEYGGKIVSDKVVNGFWIRVDGAVDVKSREV
jgi:hypothetical protein